MATPKSCCITRVPRVIPWTYFQWIQTRKGVRTVGPDGNAVQPHVTRHVGRYVRSTVAGISRVVTISNGRELCGITIVVKEGFSIEASAHECWFACILV